VSPAPVVASAPLYHAPVVAAAPLYHAPVVASAPLYHAPAVANPAPLYHAPAVAKPAPLYHAPVVANPAPLYHAPAVANPAPLYHAPVVASAHLYQAPVVIKSAPLYTAPAVAKLAPLYHAPIKSKPAPLYHAPVARTSHVAPAYGAPEVYPDEVLPYTYQYAVADDYSGSRFTASETDDGTAARTGSYSVNLPDGRIQTVNYHANDIDGYVAEVTYTGEAAFPAGIAPVAFVQAVHAAPVAVSQAAHAAPTAIAHKVHAAHPLAQLVAHPAPGPLVVHPVIHAAASPVDHVTAPEAKEQAQADNTMNKAPSTEKKTEATYYYF